MGTLKKIGLLAIFLFLALALLSWQSGLYGKHCEQIKSDQEKCALYNLAPFILIEIAYFLEHYESFFLVLATLAIAWFTFELRRSTDRLWLAGEKQLAITETAAIAAKASADASLVALRPWLSCEVKVAGPLKFVKGDAVFKFDFIIKNVGHSPAIRVNFSPHMTLSSPQHEPAIIWLKRGAEFNRDFPVKTTTILIPSGVNLGSEETGLVLFPNESHAFNYTLRINREEIEKSCEDLKLSKSSRYIIPIVCGLATYNYPLAKVRADTGFAYPMRKKTGQTRGVFYLNKSIPQKDIIFDTDFSGNGFAT